MPATHTVAKTEIDANRFLMMRCSCGKQYVVERAPHEGVPICISRLQSLMIDHQREVLAP